MNFYHDYYVVLVCKFTLEHLPNFIIVCMLFKMSLYFTEMSMQTSEMRWREFRKWKEKLLRRREKEREPWRGNDHCRPQLTIRLWINCMLFSMEDSSEERERERMKENKKRDKYCIIEGISRHRVVTWVWNGFKRRSENGNRMDECRSWSGKDPKPMKTKTLRLIWLHLQKEEKMKGYEDRKSFVYRNNRKEK